MSVESQALGYRLAIGHIFDRGIARSRGGSSDSGFDDISSGDGNRR